MGRILAPVALCLVVISVVAYLKIDFGPPSTPSQTKDLETPPEADAFQTLRFARIERDKSLDLSRTQEQRTEALWSTYKLYQLYIDKYCMEEDNDSPLLPDGKKQMRLKRSFPLDEYAAFKEAITEVGNAGAELRRLGEIKDK